VTTAEPTIRQYDVADLDACRALWVELTEQHRKVYEDPTIGGDRPGLHFDRHMERAGVERTWVAVHEGRVVGLAALLLDGEDAEVDEHRGRGVGRALVVRAVMEARRLGVRFLSVRPAARNSEVFAFYHRLGFRALGCLELFMDLKRGESALKRGPDLFDLPWLY
jgi:GNAT superfamily N-acetyltransferase